MAVALWPRQDVLLKTFARDISRGRVPKGPLRTFERAMANS